MSIRDILMQEKIQEQPAAVRATTLEAHHQQKMRDFTEERQSLQSLRSALSALEAEMPCAPPLSDEWKRLSDEAEALRKQIAAIDRDEHRLNYFLDVGDMLFQYYEAQDYVAKGAPMMKTKTPTHLPANSVLSYFAKAEPAVVEPKSPVKASTIEIKDGMNRDKLLEKYLAVVEPSAIKSGIMPGSGIEPGWGVCRPAILR
jgi:hypothetical protein